MEDIYRDDPPAHPISAELWRVGLTRANILYEDFARGIFAKTIFAMTYL